MLENIKGRFGAEYIEFGARQLDGEIFLSNENFEPKMN